MKDISKLIKKYENLNKLKVKSSPRYDRLSEGFVTIDQVLIDLTRLKRKEK